MFIAIIFLPDCDVINFEIDLVVPVPVGVHLPDLYGKILIVVLVP